VSEPSPSPDFAAAGGEHFVTTHWSAVVRAGQTNSASADEALAELCRTYWYPLYGFIRRQGRTPQDAEDLTQAFLARLLEKNFVAAASQEKGKFRTFLLIALKRFMANEWDREHAQKRGGFQTAVDIDQAMAEARFNAELVHDLQPDVLFERQWAMTLLERVMSQLQEEYTATGRAKLFEHLRSCLVKEESAQPYAIIAMELNLTEAAVKTAVHRLRTRYREILRMEIGKTVVSPEDVELELRHLFSIFSR
jgi:DNA-directed RNA polymerase specialized sigma24 family protein